MAAEKALSKEYQSKTEKEQKIRLMNISHSQLFRDDMVGKDN